MLMTILFDVIVVCFALALICWSASELLHIWQAGVIMSLIFLVGTLALLVRLVVVCVSGNVLVDDNIWTIFTFTFAVMALYLHFRLFGTMIMPAASVLLVVVEMLQHVGLWPQLGFAFDISGEPWLDSAVVLAMVGLGIALACVLLGASTLSRRGRLAEAERIEAELKEIPDEAAFRAHSLRLQFIDVSRKMPCMLSHLGWWALAILSFAIGGFVLWCYTRYGIYWAWQPLFALSALVWALLFVGKDMLFIRSK